jgi:hypothetical protein
LYIGWWCVRYLSLGQQQTSINKRPPARNPAPLTLHKQLAETMKVGTYVMACVTATKLALTRLPLPVDKQLQQATVVPRP